MNATEGRGGFDLPLGDLAQGLRRTTGETAEARQESDEAEPRIVLKPSHDRFPTIEESRRDDPAVGVRPTFDTPLRRAGMLDAYRAADLAFGDASSSGAAPDGFAPVPVDAPWPDAARLQPLPHRIERHHRGVACGRLSEGGFGFDDAACPGRIDPHGSARRNPRVDDTGRYRADRDCGTAEVLARPARAHHAERDRRGGRAISPRLRRHDRNREIGTRAALPRASHLFRGAERTRGGDRLPWPRWCSTGP